MSAVGRRSAVGWAVALAVIAFAIAFLVARSLADGAGDDGGHVQDLPRANVSIENLDRAPSIKPLRSVAGEPATPAPAQAAPGASAAPASGQ